MSLVISYTLVMASENKNTTRGFAGMDKERQREIASMGGKMAHSKGPAHKFNSEEASKAGKIGGLGRANKLSKEERIEIARKGGEESWKNR